MCVCVCVFSPMSTAQWLACEVADSFIMACAQGDSRMGCGGVVEGGGWCVHCWNDPCLKEFGGPVSGGWRGNL